MRFRLVWVLVVGLGGCAAALVGEDTKPEPAASPAQQREFGLVRWQRDHRQALADASKLDKPVFLLFQEVPGCSTCVTFGQRVLSHPLLAEAIETEFVPLAICNNKQGADRDVLQRYEEPAWNNPVVRFVDAQGTDLIPRRDRIWTVAGIAGRMIQTLAAAKRPVPKYLEVVARESDIERSAKATFAMFCYYEGEARLGSIDGVLTTRAGILDRREVVEVTYDPLRVSLDAFVKKAQQMKCASLVYGHTDEQYAAIRALVGQQARRLKQPAENAAWSEQKVSLRNTPYGYLPLTPMQATKINAALRLGADPDIWLSPRQGRMHSLIADLLAKAPTALADLQRPTSVAELAEYEQELILRLVANAR